MSLGLWVRGPQSNERFSVNFDEIPESQGLFWRQVKSDARCVFEDKPAFLHVCPVFPDVRVHG